MDRKDFFIIILLTIVFSLFYFILIGSFCHCSFVRCPNSDIPLRSYLS